VAVVGRPNVGKSSLVNALVGQKVAIVSDVPQTTRSRIRGALTTEEYQIVFTDTPGFHKPRTVLGERLNRLVGESVEDVDVLLQVVDAAAGVGRGDAFVYERHLAHARRSRFCAVNKIDLVPRDRLVRELEAAGRLGAFDEIVPVSARTGSGLPELTRLLAERLPEGPPLFPPGEATDQTFEQRVAELIREQAIRLTREEVPHSVVVTVDDVERVDALLRIAATIFLERDSQKGILIGRGGEMLKRIGTRARQEIESLVGTKVYLDLRVKVQKEWQRDPRALNRLGF